MSKGVVRRIRGSASASAVVALLGAVPLAAAQTPGAGISAPQTKPRTEVDAAAAQNPISNMISVPFQNNTSFSAAPLGRGRTCSWSSRSFRSISMRTGTW